MRVIGSNNSDRSVCTGHVVSAVFHMWVLGSNIAIIIRNVRTGHVVRGMRSTYGWWDLP